MKISLILKKWKPISIGALLGITLFLGLYWVTSFQKETYFDPVAIRLDSSGLPCIEVLIEGTFFPVVIDLGSDQQLSLNSDALASLDKTACGVERWVNFKGLEFVYPKYILPKIKIGSLEFNHVTAVSFPPERAKDSIIWECDDKENTQPKTMGTLGREFLGKTNALVDTKKSKIIFTNHIKRLEEKGYNVSSFARIPFTLTPIGIILDIQTDLGHVKLMVDTGCTYTMFRDALYPKNIKDILYRHGLPTLTTKKFLINGIDFGDQELHFLDIAEDFQGIDGALGMDFIKKHVIYIDFKNTTIYVQEN